MWNFYHIIIVAFLIFCCFFNYIMYLLTEYWILHVFPPPAPDQRPMNPPLVIPATLSLRFTHWNDAP